jgi:hypothetical protein
MSQKLVKNESIMSQERTKHAPRTRLDGHSRSLQFGTVYHKDPKIQVGLKRKKLEMDIDF